ncbi:GAF domain-containing SpoIIE family protein phosphatase [Cnuibacter sp. UC19_7]|uniref:GAF domain-containing SpoIIE family protein phosphatase n=1 Tax=Cnuibacter sp. UC19_7 TaxID=3350166 RepID=UPI00366B476D
MTTDADRRDAAVERLGLMDTGPEERYDRITRLAKDVFDVDHAVVNVVDSTTIFTKSQPEGGTFRHTPPTDSFCAVTVEQDDLLEVDDATRDDRFSERAIVTEHGIRFYAGLPLKTEDGDTVATLCLLDSQPRTLSDEDREAFARMGAWAEAEIQLDDIRATPVKAAPLLDSVDGDGVTVSTLAIPYGAVSGDRGAWREVGETVLVALTDVMGKGEAQGALAQRIVGALLDGPGGGAAERPLDAVVRVEDDLDAQHALDTTFATLFHAAIDTVSGRVEYVDAGHGLTLLIAADGGLTRLASHNLPLGLRPPGVPWEAGEVTVASGDLLISVSDGVLDAYDSTLESLRMLADDLRAAQETREFLDRLTVRVSEHVVDDDVTAVVVSVH